MIYRYIFTVCTGYKEQKMKRGFTLIELMVVVAVIAIIAAVAIPNLMRSRIQANESAAMAALKAYSAAQVTFQTGKYGRITVNTNAGSLGYADNFRNLHYGNEINFSGDAVPNSKIELINEGMANAFVAGQPNGGVSGAAGTVGGYADALPFQGFRFCEPSLDTSNFLVDFSLMAIPVNGGHTGNNLFWIGRQGSIMMHPVTPESTDASNYNSIKAASPSHRTVMDSNWINA